MPTKAQEDLLKIYGSFAEAGKQSRKYAEDKQSIYEKAIVKKLSKCRFVVDDIREVTTLAQLEGTGCPWYFGSYKSKTNFRMSTLIKSLDRTAVWTKYLDLKDWYPNSYKLALVFSCPSNGYNDLVLLGDKPNCIDHVPWSVGINIQGDPVYLMNFKSMLENI